MHNIGQPWRRESFASPCDFEVLPETSAGSPTSYYRALCPVSGAELSLMRSTLAEEICRHLARELTWSEGKMVGVLLARDQRGRLGYAKAHSGGLEGQALQPRWVPPLHSPAPLPSEAPTLAALEEWKTALARLSKELEDHPYPRLEAEWKRREELLRLRHGQNKLRRQEARRSGGDHGELASESQRESRERKELRREREAALSAPRAEILALRQAIEHGRCQRRALSRALQKEMHEGLGQTLGGLLEFPLESLFPSGVPTGTGDCCAPKLLGWAIRNGLRPAALAEMWCGPSVGARRAGEFYAPCQERCQPLMGPLLAVALREPIAVLHQDETLIVAVKPSGLLTVPGRYHWNQSSLATQLKALPVHRLDLETSGLVVLARDLAAQAALRRQFAEGTVEKSYQAILSSTPELHQGRIERALGRDPNQPGCYRLDAAGKPAITDYSMLDKQRVELRPHTGRSHQLRVHMAQALHCPIAGDRLYGQGGERLKLHACRLELTHPQSQERLRFYSPPPF